VTPAQQQGDYAEHGAANKKRNQTKNRTHAESHIDAGSIALLHLHQILKHTRGVDQRVQQLRTCPEAEQYEDRIGDIAWRGGVDIINSAIVTSDTRY